VCDFLCACRGGQKEVEEVEQTMDSHMELIECVEKGAKDNGQRTERASATARPGDVEK
jgi:hypothetical protein